MREARIDLEPVASVQQEVDGQGQDPWFVRSEADLMGNTIRSLNHRNVVFQRAASLAFLFSFICSAPLAAQVPSRSAVLRANREAKVEQGNPPQRNSIEKGLRVIERIASRYNRVREGIAGFYFASGDFPAGSGVGFGLGYENRELFRPGVPEPDRANRVDFSFTAAYTTREYSELRSEIKYLNIGGTVFNMDFRGRYSEFPEEDFFGIGLESREGDRSNYLFRSIDGGSNIWLEPTRRLRVGVGAFYLNPSVGSGRDDRYPSVESLFDTAEVSGFEGGQPDFLRVDAFVDIDRRDRPLYPRSGTFLGAKFSNYRDRHFDKFHFRRWELDAQQYLPFDNGYKVLALRANVVMTDVGARDDMPFYYMPTLGGRSRLRGFREYRFRDRNSVLATAEYRWEAWWALDTALFVDGGKVASRRADIDLSDWEVGYGIGFRFHSKEAFTIRLHLGFSREGFVPMIRGEHVF